MNHLLQNNLFSFFGRLAIYSVCALATGSYFTGLAAYLFLDLVVMDQTLKYFFGLKKISSGLDTVFLRLDVCECFYVTLERRMETIQDLMDQFRMNSEGLERFNSRLV